MINSTKLGRLIRAMFGITPGRKGSCKPDKCSTLDGQQGGACCKLGGRCAMLAASDSCSIHGARPLNCRSFPTTPDDLKLVKNCGYYW